LTDLGPLDLLGKAAGVTSFDGLWQRSIIMNVYGVTVHVASLDDLIAMKRAAGRPKDQNHILELEALRKLTQEADETDD
jgi:predicted nucleotidyltransferase